MSTQSFTDEGNAYRDPLDTFIDREKVLGLFQQILCFPQPGQFCPLAIKGSSGTGKTFLVEYLAKRICPKFGYQCGQISFAQSIPDFRSILEGIENALNSCVSRESLERYRTKRDEYNQRFDKYRASLTILQTIEATKHSSIANVNQNIQINVQLREREIQLRAELGRALIELSEESIRPLCLFIDGYERLTEVSSELIDWLWEEVLLNLAKTAPQPLLVVTCGWDWPSNAVIKPFLQVEILDDFDLARVRSYLHKQEVVSPNLSAIEQDELVTVFYDLTQGHPLVLGLAVTYFQELNIRERTAASLRTKRQLVNDRASVEFFNERLLSRLSEPYRTLLERGPILRSLDQAALQTLLSAESEGARATIGILDNQTYERFLLYPFINHERELGNVLVTRSIFHDLVRRVQLETLRHLHPETKEQLHRVMAEYYGKKVIIGQERETTHSTGAKVASETDGTKGVAGILEKEFEALLEHFYHGLQVKEIQVLVFEVWKRLTRRAMKEWQRQRVRLLLEVVQQLVEEGEPFLSRTGGSYGHYLILNASFLDLEVHWEEARSVLEEAIKIFKQEDNLAEQSSCLNTIGEIYRQHGKLEEALDYHKQALALLEWEDSPIHIATSLNNIGGIYQQKGKLGEALDYYKQVLALSELEGDPDHIASSLNNIGVIYQQQGKLGEALGYYKRALTLVKQTDDPDAVAQNLNNLGFLYQQQGRLEKALDYYKRALALFEQVGNPDHIATSLNNLGFLYQQQGRLGEALDYYKRALALFEQVGNPANIARSFNNIGVIYRQQGRLGEALDYYKQASVFLEQVGDPIHIATSLNNLGVICQAQGKLEEALDYYKRALAVREQVGDPAAIAQSFHNIGEIYYDQGKSGEALSYLEHALSLREQVGDPAAIADSLHDIAIIYQEQEKWEQAIEPFFKALNFYEQLGHGFELKVATELEGLAICHYRLGKLEKVEPYYKRAQLIRQGFRSIADVANQEREN